MARNGPGESRIQGILRSYAPIKGAFFFFFPYTGGKLNVYVFKHVFYIASLVTVMVVGWGRR